MYLDLYVRIRQKLDSLAFTIAFSAASLALWIWVLDLRQWPTTGRPLVFVVSAFVTVQGFRALSHQGTGQEPEQRVFI